MAEDREAISFEYKGKQVRVLLGDINEELDSDKLTRIDLNNIVGEVVTFPAVINKLSNLLALADEKVRDSETRLKIEEATFKDDMRTQPSGNSDAKGNDKGWTNDQINEKWRSSKMYKILKNKWSLSLKNRDILNGIYWSCKDKSNKLDKISENITEDDLNGMKDCVINGMKVIIRNTVIK